MEIGRDGYAILTTASQSPRRLLLLDGHSITTTGYGDIRPVSDETRLVTTLIVTPARILFLILLVGTRSSPRASASRSLSGAFAGGGTLRDHIIICGFGTKDAAPSGAAAPGVEAHARSSSIDPTRRRAGAATAAAASRPIAGDAASTERARPRPAMRRRRAAVVVAVHRDDAAVLDAHRARAASRTRRSSPPCARRRTCSCCARAAPTR